VRLVLQQLVPQQLVLLVAELEQLRLLERQVLQLAVELE
jgi:hypothetical protein